MGFFCWFHESPSQNKPRHDRELGSFYVIKIRSPRMVVNPKIVSKPLTLELLKNHRFVKAEKDF